MNTQVTLSIDNKIFDFAQNYAKQKGLSVNELLEYYIRIIMVNEHIQQAHTSRFSDTNFALMNNIGLKKQTGILSINDLILFVNLFLVVSNSTVMKPMNDKVFIDTNLLVYFIDYTA